MFYSHTKTVKLLEIQILYHYAKIGWKSSWLSSRAAERRGDPEVFYIASLRSQ